MANIHMENVQLHKREENMDTICKKTGGRDITVCKEICFGFLKCDVLILSSGSIATKKSSDFYLTS